MLEELIRHYTDACRLQQNLETFSELARDFYYNGSDTKKGMIIDHLIQTEKEFEDPITF